MRKLFDSWHPENWTLKFYAWTLGLLLALNLFGPKGFIQWVIVKQEAVRLEAKQADLQRELQSIKAQTRRFEISDLAKLRAIREELGYLRDDEVSIEFTEPVPEKLAPKRPVKSR